MSGLIGKKIGMTSIFDENGKNIPCTVIEVGPCIVTQVRTKEVDGYEALQLGFDDKTEKSANKAEIGHSKKAGTSVKKKVDKMQYNCIIITRSNICCFVVYGVGYYNGIRDSCYKSCNSRL